MVVHLTSAQNMFQPQARNPLRSMMGPDAGLQKVIQQINANYGGRKNHDTVEWSQKALELLDAAKTEKAAEAKKPEATFGPRKYAPEMFTKEEWAEQALSAQRDGLQTASDVIDYAKSKLRYTMSKISELENYLNGTGTHSDPAMTKELAETYLHNYKQSIQSDYTEILHSHINPHRSTVDEYDRLSGGLASAAMDNQLHSLSAESLGLSNLSGDPREIMEALENASKTLDGMKQNVEDAYREMTDGKQFAEPAGSTSVFDGNTSHNFFASQMETSHRILDTARMKLTGQTLRFQ